MTSERMTETREVRLDRLQVGNLGRQCVNLKTYAWSLQDQARELERQGLSVNELFSQAEMALKTVEVYQFASGEVRSGKTFELTPLRDGVGLVMPHRGYGMKLEGGVVERMLWVMYGPMISTPPITSRSPLRTTIDFGAMTRPPGTPEVAKELADELNDGVVLYFRATKNVGKDKLPQGFPVDRAFPTPEEIRYFVQKGQMELSDWNDEYNQQQRRAAASIDWDRPLQ